MVLVDTLIRLGEGTFHLGEGSLCIGEDKLHLGEPMTVLRPVFMLCFGVNFVARFVIVVACFGAIV